MRADLTLHAPPERVLIPQDAGKHRRSKLGKLTAWLEDTGRSWHDPDLTAYRDHLLAQGHAPSYVRGLLSTARAEYRRLIHNNDLRDALEVTARAALEEKGDPYGPADVEALVNRKLARLRNATDPEASSLTGADRPTEAQDEPDEKHRRLTKAQADALLAAPGVDTLRGLRDTALIALMLCTGVREAEAVGLEVRDLRQHLGGELALHVREGKGRKARLIPYGDLDWVLVILDAWLAAAGIESGPVFRGFYQGYTTIRDGALSTRAVGYILQEYPIVIDGEPVTVTPHDLRRTYARRLFAAGVDPVAIKQNLGHASLETTLGYIGTLDAQRRRAPAIYSFDVGGLYRQERLPGS
jgi:site-specific recombinase XerD